MITRDLECPWHDYCIICKLWRHARWFRKFTVLFRPIRKELESSMYNNKQLLDEVFVISRIIKVELRVISRSRRLRLITLTETLIILDITKTESNNCFIIHCFEENNDKRIIAAITVYFQTLKTIQLSDKQIFTVFIKQSSAKKLNAFLKKVSLNLYLQVISQFLAGSIKRVEKPFLLRCPWTWHCCPRTWHCSWKSCIARATYRLFTNL